MSKLLNISKLVLISCYLIFASAVELSAHINEVNEENYKAPAVRLSDEVLQRRIDNISSEVDYELTKEVKRRIKEYTISYTESSEKILGRVMLYFPIFEREIHKMNLPDELKYVAVVESLLRPEGTSRSGAAGLWQILKSTGKWLGMEINSSIDERRDPEKSTVVALNYLNDLYNQFGDWTLAIAAYNCGPGNMRKAIRRSGGSKNYWELRKHLPKETQEYIPRIVAAAYLMNYYHLHNLQPEIPNQDLRYISKVSLDKSVSFSELEKQLELKNGTLKKLNPSFIKARTLKSEKHKQFYIPSAKYIDFLKHNKEEVYNNILAEQALKKAIIRQEQIEKTSVKRDSIHHLGKLMNNFIEILSPIGGGQEYNIPHAMRSNLSYLRA